MSPRLRLPGLGPVSIAVAVVTAATMVLMALSSQRWDDALRALVSLDRLHAAQGHVMSAQLHVERILAGDRVADRGLVLAQLRNARGAARDLAAGQGQLAGVVQDEAPSLALAVEAAAFAASLDALAQSVERRLAAPGAVAPLELRVLHHEATLAASAVERVLLTELEADRTGRRHMDALNLGLVGLLTVLLLLFVDRTDRQRDAALRELAKSEAHLAALVASLPGIAFLLDEEGRYEEVFGANAELLFAPTERVLHRTIRDILPAGVAESSLEVVRATLASRQTLGHRYVLAVGGRDRHFEARVAPVGESGRVLWLAWDVTERDEAEAGVRSLTRLYGFLRRINQAIASATSREALMAQVCAAAREVGDFEVATACFFDEAPEVGHEVELVEALGRGEVVVDAHPRCGCARIPGTELPDGRRLSAYASVPLRVDGALVGALNLASAGLDLDREDERGLLAELASDLEAALGTLARAAEHTAQVARTRLLAAALETSPDGVLITDLDSRIVLVNRAFAELTGFSEAEAVGETPRVLRSGVHGDGFYREMLAGLRRDGHWEGEIWNRHKDGQLLAQFLRLSAVLDDTGVATHYVGVTTDQSALKAAQERVDHLSHFDPLTALPNRSLIRKRLEVALPLAGAGAGQVAVLFIDVDHFRNVNDGLGHAVGDELLAAISRRLLERLRRQDTLGRQSGDEFVAILERVSGPEEVAIVAERLLGGFRDPLRLASGEELFTQVSIGVACYPRDGGSAVELVRNAEAAMHEAKRDGRGIVRFYREDLTSAASTRVSLEARLRRALSVGLFELHYQPIVDLRSGAVMGAEALVRLKPDGGPFVGPADFIPVMEESGLIVELGAWVQLEACRQGRRWLDEGREPGFIAVNLSAVEIRSGRSEASLQAALEASGLAARYLELEVTESGLMGRGSGAESFLRGLKQLGVRLAIDDFGTGYSSLGYLKRFPVDKLKIDRSFVRDIERDPGDRQIVATVLAMARQLDLAVVAEGVETEAQRALLAELGCDQWQGYLCSRPLPAVDFAARFLGPPRAGAAAPDLGGPAGG